MALMSETDIDAIVSEVVGKLNGAKNEGNCPKGVDPQRAYVASQHQSAPSSQGTVNVDNAVSKPYYTQTAQGQEAFGTGGNEPFDLEYNMMDPTGNILVTPYPRVERMIKKVHKTVKSVDTERAMIYTEAYKKYQDDPAKIRNAKCFAELLSKTTIRIHSDELLVGETVAPPRACPVFPEYALDWIVDEMDSEVWWNRTNDYMVIDEQGKKDLHAIRDFWKGKTHQEYVDGLLTDEQREGSMLGSYPVYYPDLVYLSGCGHTIPRMQKLLKTGWVGLKQEIMECLDKLNMSNPESAAKREFYIAELIVIEGLKIYALRLAEACRQEANKPGADQQRKQELLQMAEHEEWLSENPPRTFWEAMQFWWTVVSLVSAEGNGQGISFGRPDRFLIDFYKKDMEEGKTNKWFVGELAEILYIKIHNQNKLKDDETCALNSEIGIGGPMVLVGGMDEKGNDITNDLSFIFLEALAHTQLPDPWMAGRWSIKTPWELKVKLVNVIKMGMSQPKLFNDEGIIPNFLAAGRSIDEARDYSVSGCVEINTGGCDYSMQDAAYFNIARALELALNHGYCVNQDSSKEERVGPDFGGLDTFHNIEEVKDAYRKELGHFVALMCGFINACDTSHARNRTLPYLSLCIEDCIKKGKDVTEGGARYSFSGPQAVGIGTVADSLSAIDQLVFKQKACTGAEMLQALKDNWVGHEKLQKMVGNNDVVPHFGNDDDYADDFARFATDAFMDELDKHTNYKGQAFHAGLYSVSGNVALGHTQGATPDGRTYGEALANCVGPVQTKANGNHDVNGPVAMVHSAAKLDHLRAQNGTLLNVRFSPSAVSGDQGRDNMLAFIDDYFSRRPIHMQFNICNTETLKDAQKYPEKYPTLMVRVAGYSAFFTRLAKELQDDLIGRNSYDAFD